LIQVGQVLDKYELLERVGQGGMAVVYRGTDRSLKRTVAIKILHRHLADDQEARDRFEREAQAVAKLRHENILEIFDYSSKAEEESYIVTEFIDGETLKQFITARPIAYPEVGAMVILQVARALAHAHGAGILHRDLKPENVMIRSDGVVKLMDFGISHMVDLERLTVTGQLLGSPAYMAPEHVEGRPLDFRTDVFALGIVLYQLTTGKLPFEGKNPHEVLKRIAECRFVDPRQVNPRIGNRLGRIILRAMAAAPADRYPGVGELVIALEGYLDESGIAADKAAGELARFFQAPAAYELALRERLLDHLSRRGRELLATDRSAALDVFDRVLTIDPANAKVLALLEGVNRRARLRLAALCGVGALALGGLGYALHVHAEPPQVAPPPAPQIALAAPRTGPVQTVAHEAVVTPPPVAPDAAPAVVAPPDAVRAVVVATHHEVAAPPDAPAPTSPPTVTVKVSPTGGQYSVAGGPWQPIKAGSFDVPVGDTTVPVEIQNPCCQETQVNVTRGDAPHVVALPFLGATVTAICAVPGVSAKVGGTNVPFDLTKSPPSGDVTVFFDKNALSSTKTVPVVFTTGQKNDSQMVTVTAGQPTEVKCAL
jgi:serine/threonine-protein kinase